MKRLYAIIAAVATMLAAAAPGFACTGIALTSKDGGRVVARTVEWGSGALKSSYVVVPRGYTHRSFTPEGENGMEFISKYGYVGTAVEIPQFVVEGMNETGLSAGLFFFPGYGSYKEYDPCYCGRALADMQFVTWVLSSFSSIDQVKEAMREVDVISLNHAVGSVHWRISEPSGRMVVLEIVGGENHFYENTLGVLTNAPSFEWQMTNLNNYVNLFAGAAPENHLTDDVVLKAFGATSGILGLPGDYTPPSRFVRAAFFQATAPQLETSSETVIECFNILGSIKIPIGIEFPKDKIPEGLPSATQFTVVTDQAAHRIYYRTAWNSKIRCIDLAKIDFLKVKYRVNPLDDKPFEEIEMIKIR